ncbi:MAG: CDP-alcohol phosphatidyltransferase family protein [Candidatus Marsarchaeota archaeon]|nr:CDP-alcohol phosphatidyltransferase family protein [Candidatus Marsarchaeota archaeon]
MLKNSLSDFQSRVGEFFKWLPLHPNDITILSVVFAAVGAYFVYQQSVLGPILFLLSFLIDGLDGAVARAKNLTSAFGAYLDGVCDRLVEFLALVPLLLSPLLFWPSLITLFFGSCMTAFSKAYADHREAVEHQKAAKLSTLMPRTERVIGIWVGLVLFVTGRHDILIPLMWILAAGSILSFLWLQFAVWRAGQGRK